MVRYTVVDGIAFVEADLPAYVIAPIETELNGFFEQKQLKSLSDLQKKMAQVVREKGGNAVVGFQYGQKSTFLKSLFKMDDVYWYGSGMIVILDPATLQ